MTNLIDIMKSRYSLREYDAKRVPSREILDQVLEAAHWAPSAVNRQPWKFTVVLSKPGLEALREVYARPWFSRVPCVVIVWGRRELSWVRPSDGWNSLETDLAIAMDHLTLAACALGLGSCWISNFDRNKLKEFLGLKDGEEAFSLTPLGYPMADDLPKAGRDRKPLREIIDFR